MKKNIVERSLEKMNNITLKSAHLFQAAIAITIALIIGIYITTAFT
jgi:hypothetical protein